MADTDAGAKLRDRLARLLLLPHETAEPMRIRRYRVGQVSAQRRHRCLHSSAGRCARVVLCCCAVVVLCCCGAHGCAVGMGSARRLVSAQRSRAEQPGRTTCRHRSTLFKRYVVMCVCLCAHCTLLLYCSLIRLHPACCQL